MQSDIIGYRKNGAPIRVIRGGSEQATEGAGATEGTSTPAEGSEAAGGTKKAPAGGKEALLADLAGERDARQGLQAQLDSILGAFRTVLGGDQPEEVTPESLAEQINALKAQMEEQATEALHRVIVSEVRSAAVDAGFHNPADALSRIEEVQTTSDGQPDVDWIKAEVQRIAEASPYLVKQGPGNLDARDVGLGGGTGQQPVPKTAGEKIAAGLAATSKK